VKEPLPIVERPSPAELRRWWDELREEQPDKPYQAVWRFAAVKDQTIPFLAEVLRPRSKLDPATVCRLIADLDADDFEVRERASGELKRLGESVASALKSAKKTATSLEQERRIDRLLLQLTTTDGDRERWREIRALAALEQIGGAEARKLLVRLAEGPAGATLTMEAKASLKRLDHAPK
jgi:hypothetical protein